jgi:hypothetical protein
MRKSALACYLQHIEEEIAETNMRNRRLRCGLGKVSLDEYLLPPNNNDKK